MRHDETRDNTTAIEANLSEADAHADTREGVEGSDPTGRETWRERKLRLAIATFGPIRSNEPDPAGVQLGNDPEDPEHDPIGDADTDYDIEYDDEPEDGDESAADYDEGWPPVGGGHFNDGMW